MIRIKKNDMGSFGPDLGTEFRCGSCWHSHFSWRGHIWKMLPECRKTHSKTPIDDSFSKSSFWKNVQIIRRGPGPSPLGREGPRPLGPYGPICAHMGGQRWKKQRGNVKIIITSRLIGHRCRTNKFRNNVFLKSRFKSKMPHKEDLCTYFTKHAYNIL